MPKIGDRVEVTFNGLGTGEIIGFFVESGYMGVVVKPDNRPDWHIKQNGDRHPNYTVFGAEIKFLENDLKRDTTSIGMTTEQLENDVLLHSILRNDLSVILEYPILSRDRAGKNAIRDAVHKLKRERDELWGVLNAVRVAVRFNMRGGGAALRSDVRLAEGLRALLPRINEVLNEAQSQAD